MAEKRGQYQYNDDGSISSLVAGDIAIEESRVIVPVDIQARLSKTEQTHSGVAVGPSGWGYSSWFDTEGFDEVAFNISSSVSHLMNFRIQWSNDGTNIHGHDDQVADFTTQIKSGISKTKLKWCRLAFFNGSAAPVTPNSFCTLKA